MPEVIDLKNRRTRFASPPMPVATMVTHLRDLAAHTFIRIYDKQPVFGAALAKVVFTPGEFELECSFTDELEQIAYADQRPTNSDLPPVINMHVGTKQRCLAAVRFASSRRLPRTIGMQPQLHQTNASSLPVLLNWHRPWSRMWSPAARSNSPLKLTAACFKVSLIVWRGVLCCSSDCRWLADRK